VTTLWPELDKLYGHGYETLSVAASPDGRFCASSCKSTSPEHALVRLHDWKQQWKEIETLPGHSLSVTRLRFSSDGSLLLTVSRDRSWRLFKRSSDGNSYQDDTSLEKAHARILWDAAWLPGGESFVTVSRDKTAKVWAVRKGADGKLEVALDSTIAVSGAATSVAVSADKVLAVGLENGEIRLFKHDAGSQTWTAAGVLTAHTEAVAGLQFRPGSSKQLLSAGEDGLTQLFSL
jgi:elongator complex protein 2